MLVNVRINKLQPSAGRRAARIVCLKRAAGDRWPVESRRIQSCGLTPSFFPFPRTVGFSHFDVSRQPLSPTLSCASEAYQELFEIVPA